MDILPEDWGQACLVGRARLSETSDDPVPVALKGRIVVDISRQYPTIADLLEEAEPTASARAAARNGEPLGAVDELYERGRFIAPNDLQAVKAAGVTFVASLLERVVEELARGNPDRAAEFRDKVRQAAGSEIAGVKPGSPESVKLKTLLSEKGAWSQYLEVGIGPDAELFTKCQPLSAVGPGALIGIHPESSWNNPEPEIVLAINSRGAIRGATLGNDVNLRDVEGRSALLLGRAKDNNGSCALGPFIRLLDDKYSLEDIRTAVVRLAVRGADDGFVLTGQSSMAEISRDITDLVEQLFGRHHQYPDGALLFTGTMFAPIKDRDVLGAGFTHHVGDTVEITSPRLGRLINVVEYTDRLPPWNFGIRALMRSLARRGLLA